MKKKKLANKLEHPCFPQPNEQNNKVWRYIDVSKLIDIISRKSLFLCRLDLLDDTHEGSFTKIHFETRQTEYEKYGISHVIPTLEKSNKNFPKSMFVNCWYFDNYESEAMWKLYCPDNKGVAIQTSYKKLVDSVSFDDYLYIGSIQYLDYETEWFPTGNIFYPVMHKRKAFQHEKEIRLVKTDYKYWVDNSLEPPSGVYIPWEIEKYSENIYVNPYAPIWYYEVIKDLLKTYNCKINIKWSTIKKLPYY